MLRRLLVSIILIFPLFGCAVIELPWEQKSVVEIGQDENFSVDIGEVAVNITAMEPTEKTSCGIFVQVTKEVFNQDKQKSGLMVATLYVELPTGSRLKLSKRLKPSIFRDGDIFLGCENEVVAYYPPEYLIQEHEAAQRPRVRDN